MFQVVHTAEGALDPRPFSETDLRSLTERFLDEAKLQRQIRLFREPPLPIRLDRHASTGDGIHVLTDGETRECVRRQEEAASRGRFLKFVPSSGAATRMFDAMIKGDVDGIRRFVSEIRRFAFFDDLRARFQGIGKDLAALMSQGREQEWVETLFSPSGLGYAHQPKGLIAFHRYAEGPRTAMEEQWFEAAATVRDRGGLGRIHLTVSPEHRAEFEAFTRQNLERREKEFGCRLGVGFSEQDLSTETLAVDLQNEPFRDADGRLVFRPGGHGALLRNLEGLGGDLVYVKNIDNVVPDALKGPTLMWKKVLGGLLVRLQEESFRHLIGLGSGSVEPRLVDDARDFFRRWFFRDPLAGIAEDPAAVLRRELDRPLRVCGMVRNTGEPGGGPFWVRDTTGRTTLQIVEKAQADLADPAQAQVFASSTHFNPVDLVCGMRDHRGRPHELSRWVDEDSVIISRKTHDGRALKSLEWPGLWNGAMHGWNTVLVEVPLETFDPVKTVFDLLRPRHQTGRE